MTDSDSSSILNASTTTSARWWRTRRLTTAKPDRVDLTWACGMRQGRIGVDDLAHAAGPFSQSIGGPIRGCPEGIRSPQEVAVPTLDRLKQLTRLRLLWK